MTREEVLADIEAGCPRFREWVIGQGGSYDYGRSEKCAFARFLQAQGFDRPLVGGSQFYFRVGEEGAHMLSLKLAQALVAVPHTFEALAERLA